MIGFNNSEPSQMENTQTIRSRSPFDKTPVQNEGISIIIQNVDAKKEQKQKKQSDKLDTDRSKSNTRKGSKNRNGKKTNERMSYLRPPK